MPQEPLVDALLFLAGTDTCRAPSVVSDHPQQLQTAFSCIKGGSPECDHHPWAGDNRSHCGIERDGSGSERASGGPLSIVLKQLPSFHHVFLFVISQPPSTRTIASFGGLNMLYHINSILERCVPSTIRADDRTIAAFELNQLLVLVESSKLTSRFVRL